MKVNPFSTRGRGNNGQAIIRIPKLKIVPFTPAEQPIETDKTAVDALLDLAIKFKVKLQYNFSLLSKEGDPKMYQCTVSAEMRNGIGTAGTRSEAQCEAAENCLYNLKEANPTFDFEILPYKNWVKTDPEKDILYVLDKVCKKANLGLPVYSFEVTESLNGEIKYVYTCNVGNYEGKGSAPTKRVAQRVAAINLYKIMQE